MSRPLQPKRETQNDAATFHRLTLRLCGPKCWKCWGRATDAAHVINRSHLGKHRYALPGINSRMLCRRCHQQQTDGLWDFPLSIRQQATLALNEILKVPLPVPQE